MRWVALFSTLALAACATPSSDVAATAASPDGTPPPAWGAAPDADDTAAPADTRHGEGLASSPMGRDTDRGSMTMTMHDAPIDLEAMPVTITRVEAREANSGSLRPLWHTLSDEAISFDLLELQDGREVTLMDDSLPALHYDQLRLVLEDVSVVVEGEEIKLPLPLDPGVPVDVHFSIEADRHHELVLDFDALESVVRTPLGYRLQPSIKVESFESSGGLDSDR